MRFTEIALRILEDKAKYCTAMLGQHTYKSHRRFDLHFFLSSKPSVLLEKTAKMTATGQQDASSRKNSLSLEEGLPLYAELQYTEGQTDMLPHAKASPMEVSDFLVHLLTESRDMSTDGARRLAALWTKGTGQELRSFPPAMYFEIFGKEDVWIVYREVHMALYRERSKEFSYDPCEYCLV
jgi:hypothetical protein